MDCARRALKLRQSTAAKPKAAFEPEKPLSVLYGEVLTLRQAIVVVAQTKPSRVYQSAPE
jgi:hypothetical protein